MTRFFGRTIAISLGLLSMIPNSAAFLLSGLALLMLKVANWICPGEKDE